MTKARVEEVMTWPVIAVKEHTPYKKIIAALTQHGIGAVPVLDSVGHVKGVVSDADLVFEEADPEAAEEAPVFEGPRRHREPRKPVGATAAELMSAPAHTIPPTTTVEDAAQIMREHHICRLPVTDAVTGHLLGIVSRSDLLRVDLRLDEESHAGPQTEVPPKVAVPTSWP